MSRSTLENPESRIRNQELGVATRRFFIGIPSFVVLYAVLLLPRANAQIINIWEGTGRGGSDTCNKVGSCNFCDGLIVISNLIDIFVKLMFPIATGMIVYGAIRIMFGGAKEKEVEEGRNIIQNTGWALLTGIAAWVIVNFILHVLSGNPSVPWAEIRCQ